MLSQIFNVTSQDLSAGVPKGAQCQSIGLMFKLGNLTKFQKFENKKNARNFFHIEIEKN